MHPRAEAPSHFGDETSHSALVPFTRLDRAARVSRTTIVVDFLKRHRECGRVEEGHGPIDTPSSAEKQAIIGFKSEYGRGRMTLSEARHKLVVARRIGLDEVL